MFVDQVSIRVCGGRGGDGQVAFRREKYVPRGGPAGGDGGHGGDIILIADAGLRTLLDLRRTKHYQGAAGENGRSKAQHGAYASPTKVAVPLGTIVKDRDTGATIADLKKLGDSYVVAKGGRGGRGNMRFATPVRSAPRIAERGERGQERWVDLELRLLADVGLVGFPNAGKSTLLGSVSAARPKVANYPFTTLKPILGMVSVGDETSFVMADLPGLLEGAHRGVGLGHQFLRHMGRTRLLLYVIDMAGTEDRDPYEDYQILQSEVKGYSQELADRPHCIVANKMDLPGAEENLQEFKEKVSVPIDAISAATQQGIQPFLYNLAKRIESLPAPTWTLDVQEEEEYKQSSRRVLKQKPVFIVKQLESSEEEESREYAIYGEWIEKLAERMNFSYHDSALYFVQRLRAAGVETILRKEGVKEGDKVFIGEERRLALDVGTEGLLTV